MIESREVWAAESEAVKRVDLIEVINVALRNEHRTSSEQKSLLSLIDLLDDSAICDVKLLKELAVSSWSRSHICDCGKISSLYWCSDRCHRAAEPACMSDEDAA